MNVREAYNEWANTYDTVINKTRDIEALAIKEALGNFHYTNILEIGCGTGKNTQWLHTITQKLVGADFSMEMLNKAKEKITNSNTSFIQMDITREWPVDRNHYDLITFSLVLEHIKNLNFIFHQASLALMPGGKIYLGELHPFKQYQGSKARFETGNGVFELECFIHNVSDYYNAGIKNSFICGSIKEWFDEETAALKIPRLLSMVFTKQ